MTAQVTVKSCMHPGLLIDLRFQIKFPAQMCFDNQAAVTYCKRFLITGQTILRLIGISLRRRGEGENVLSHVTVLYILVFTNHD